VCYKVPNIQRALSFIGGIVDITDQSPRPRRIKDKAITDLISRGIILSNVAKATPHGPASGSPPIVDPIGALGMTIFRRFQSRPGDDVHDLS
jgi:hypothetical protein